MNDATLHMICKIIDKMNQEELEEIKTRIQIRELTTKADNKIHEGV